ncbi:hypothetical protein, partial [Mycolicibacterium holsaticum]|uniref:hypothetical protein n=1 Tax=Mycolicibacterium holsaticum TaxID=152142 RepID=UPI00104277BD
MVDRRHHQGVDHLTNKGRVDTLPPHHLQQAHGGGDVGNERPVAVAGTYIGSLPDVDQFTVRTNKTLPEKPAYVL